MSTITEFEQMIAESAEDRKGRAGFSEPAAERIGLKIRDQSMLPLLSGPLSLSPVSLSAA
jgi:hypothetical protein